MIKLNFLRATFLQQNYYLNLSSSKYIKTLTILQNTTFFLHNTTFLEKNVSVTQKHETPEKNILQFLKDLEKGYFLLKNQGSNFNGSDKNPDDAINSKIFEPLYLRQHWAVAQQTTFLNSSYYCVATVKISDLQLQKEESSERKFLKR